MLDSINLPNPKNSLVSDEQWELLCKVGYDLRMREIQAQCLLSVDLVTFLVTSVLSKIGFKVSATKNYDKFLKEKNQIIDEAVISCNELPGLVVPSRVRKLLENIQEHYSPANSF